MYGEVGVEDSKFGSFVAKVYLWMMVGLGLAGLTGVVSYQRGWWQSIWILIGTFVLTIATIFIMYATNDKFIEIPAFILFNFGIGVGLGYIPAYYEGVTIAQGVAITSGIFLLFSIIAWRKPEYFTSFKFGILLLLSLLGVIIVEVILLFISPGFLDNPAWNGFVALIFVGFILYDTSKLHDWYRQGFSEIDCAVQFILDFINLLIRILAILGRKRD